MVTSDGSSKQEIKRRIALGKAGAGKLDTLLKDTDLNRGTNKNIMRSIDFPVMTYGSELAKQN